jgi:hypothetical protein
MTLACIRKSSLNFQVFYDAVDGSLGGGPVRQFVHCHLLWHHYRMGSGTGSPKSNSNNGTVAVSRHVLPSDLPTAIKHLDDQELNQLFAAVVAERLQRGMKSPVPDKIPNKRSVEATAVSLTPGKLSAVRAAFKAGVTPTKIAKEFGLSQADVRSVIASDKR